MSLSLDDATVVLRLFGLPAAGGLRALSGGLSHEMYQVTTTEGTSYALKRLVAHTHRPDFARELDRAWAVETRMVAAGLPLPRPVPDPISGRGWLRVVGLGMFRLHEYVDAVPLGRYAEDPASVSAAGALLGRVHLAAEPAPPQSVDLAGFGWAEAAADLGDAHPAAAVRFRAALPSVEGLTRALRRDPVILRPSLSTHRDMDPKNVLRSADGALVLVDWDVAASADPSHELTVAALDWGGAVDRRFDPNLGDRFLQGYRSAGGPAHPVADGMGIWLLQYLRWLEYGVRQLARAAREDNGQPSGPGASGLGLLPGRVADDVVTWGARWAPQTLADLPALRAWVAGHRTG